MGESAATMNADCVDSDFLSEGVRCAGRLYLPHLPHLPRGAGRPPVVVMGHGLGALKEFRIPAYAERFVERGLAVFTFDYRHWGGSDGAPRQLLVPRRQLRDWHAALAHVRGLAPVDGARLGIWGSSFGGAHVVHVAAEDHDVKAVVSQVLAADTAKAVAGFGWKFMLGATASGTIDAIGAAFGMAPRYYPLVGKPGERAVMNTPECWDGYMGLVPEGAPWQNAVAARSLLLIPFYRAIRVADRVRSPTLLMAGVNDSLVAISDIRALAARLAGSVLKEYDCNHFEPYYPPLFETFVREQANFFVDRLAPA